MGLFSNLFSNDIKKRNESYGMLNYLEEQQKKDRELEELGLEDWQKELVKKGEYSPEDFEEEELDEDSYYEEED